MLADSTHPVCPNRGHSEPPCTSVGSLKDAEPEDAFQNGREPETPIMDWESVQDDIAPCKQPCNLNEPGSFSVPPRLLFPY